MANFHNSLGKPVLECQANIEFYCGKRWWRIGGDGGDNQTLKCVNHLHLAVECFSLVVSTGASDWLERLFSEMTYNVLMRMLNSTLSLSLKLLYIIMQLLCNIYYWQLLYCNTVCFFVNYEQYVCVLHLTQT